MGNDLPQPQLALSDIMHNMSPSPSINDEQRQPKTFDPHEPLSEDDVVRMRGRIADMGLTSDSKPLNNGIDTEMTTRERELGSMVVKLLDSFIEPSQLVRQADFIGWLTIQRDLLVQSFEEERKRWEAEREGWTRMAEALLAQRAKAANSPNKDEEFDRQCATYESENKALREKLQDAQLRFSSLESELNKLKPLLLMQPPLYASSNQKVAFCLSDPTTGVDSRNKSLKGKQRDSTRIFKPVASEEQGFSDLEGALKEPNHLDHLNGATPSQPTSSDYYHRHDAPRHSQSSTMLTPFQSVAHSSIRSAAQQTPTRSSNAVSTTHTPSTHPGQSKKPKSKTKRSLSGNLVPLSADARTEHLLLAARKVGRDRANIMSGFMRRIEKEKEKLMQEQETERQERERLDRATTGNGGGAGNLSYYRKDVVDLGMSPVSVSSSNTPSMPKTPKKGSSAGGLVTQFLSPTLLTPRSDFYPHQTFTPSSFVFVGTPPATSYGDPTLATPKRTGQILSTTHSATKQTQAQAAPPASSIRPNNPPTPLDSLLSAARSMMDDNDNDGGLHPNGRRRAAVLEPPESPLPKRRRVGNADLSNSGGRPEMLGKTTTPGTDRIRSGLDVLADQAAAAFNSDRHSSVKPTSRNKGKAKGSVLSHSSTQDGLPSEEETDNDLTPKAKAREARKAKSHSSDTNGSPMSTRSRSKILSAVPAKTLASKKADGARRAGRTPRLISSPAPRLITPPRQSSRNELDSLDTPPASISETDVFSERNEANTPPADSIASTSANPLDSPDGDARNENPRAIPDTPDTGSHTPLPDVPMANSTAEHPTRVVETPVATDPSVAMLEDEDAEGENDPDIREDHDTEEQDAEGEPDGEDETEGVIDTAMADQSQADQPSSAEDHDTDADAEGEMDMDAEDTIVVNATTAHGASADHETLPTASPSPLFGEIDTGVPAAAHDGKGLEVPQLVESL